MGKKEELGKKKAPSKKVVAKKGKENKKTK